MAPLKTRMHRWRQPCALLLVLLAGMAGAAGADSPAVEAQRKIEAAYLYKFGGYVSWPDSAFSGPESPIVIGVAGADALASELEALVEGRSIAGRPVAVRRLQPGDALDGIQILFVGTRSDALMASAQDQPVLVVTAGPDGLQRGAMISFVLVDEHVRFDVALDPVQKSGLKLSSQLLSVADKVEGARP